MNQKMVSPNYRKRKANVAMDLFERHQTFTQHPRNYDNEDEANSFGREHNMSQYREEGHEVKVRKDIDASE